MVGMVKRLTRRIVAPLRAGSNPVTHPNFSFWGVAKSVRHRTLTPVCVGSSPATPAIYGPLAQSVEHLTFNQGVPRSSRGWITRKTAPVRKNRSFSFLNRDPVL